MLHTGSLDERFDYSPIDDDALSNDDEEEEEKRNKNNIKDFDRLNPNICSKCKKNELKLKKYPRNDAKNNVLFCKNCGYFCISCGGFIHGLSKPSRKTDIMCENGHKIYP